MNTIPEFLIYPNDKKVIIEQNHFIIQTVRIPLKEEPSIRKIIQVALNIGQCQGKGNKFNIYLKNRTKLSDYISKKDIKRLSNIISNKTLNDINKYLTKWEKKIK